MTLSFIISPPQIVITTRDKILTSRRMDRTLLLAGLGLAAYYYALDEAEREAALASLEAGVKGVVDGVSEVASSIQEGLGGEGGEGEEGGGGSSKPKPPPPAPAPPKKELPAWAATIVGINDEILKPLVGDLVIAKLFSALVNEAGTRAQVAEYRASQALKKKQDAVRSKLAALETKKQQLMTLKAGNISRLQAQEMKLLQTQQALEIKQNISAAEKQAKQAQARAKFSEKLIQKYDADVIKARQAETTKAKLTAKGAGKTYLSIFKQRTQNAFAKVMNHTRARIGRQLASIKLPKFTTRGAVHSSASLFGLLVGAYDLVRMFDPSIDIWKKNNPSAPVEEVPYQAPPPPPVYNLPLCDDAVISGLATPTNPVLCRENRPRSWESLSSSGLTYQRECPPNFRKYTYGSFDMCVLSKENPEEEAMGEYITDASRPRTAPSWRYIQRANDGSVDVNTALMNAEDKVWGAHPNLFESMPEDFFQRLGLRNFVNQLAIDISKGSSPPDPDSVPPAWRAGIANSTIALPSEGFNAAAYQGELSDPDWPFQQYRNRDDWGRFEGAVNRISRHLGVFGVPYSDVGISRRGGEDLTEDQIAAILFPDVSTAELDSANDAQNAQAIADKEAADKAAAEEYARLHPPPPPPPPPQPPFVPPPDNRTQTQRDQDNCFNLAEQNGISFTAMGCFDLPVRN